MPPFSLQSLTANCHHRISGSERQIWQDVFEDSVLKAGNIEHSEVSYKSQVLTPIQRVNEKQFMQTEWGGGGNPIFLSLSVPCENQRVHKTMKTIGPAVGALRQFIKNMTFLMRNTCRKRTNGLVWSERCSWLFSKVHEKVISFTRHTLSSGISSGSRCPAQMLTKWDPCSVRCFVFFFF